MKHLLTEEDCDKLRAQLHDGASASVGTSAFEPWIQAVQLLDQARSESFRRRCREEGTTPGPPIASASKKPALGTVSDDEL